MNPGQAERQPQAGKPLEQVFAVGDQAHSSSVVHLVQRIPRPMRRMPASAARSGPSSRQCVPGLGSLGVVDAATAPGHRFLDRASRQVFPPRQGGCSRACSAGPPDRDGEVFSVRAETTSERYSTVIRRGYSPATPADAETRPAQHLGLGNRLCHVKLFAIHRVGIAKAAIKAVVDAVVRDVYGRRAASLGPEKSLPRGSDGP